MIFQAEPFINMLHSDTINGKYVEITKMHATCTLKFKYTMCVTYDFCAQKLVVC